MITFARWHARSDPTNSQFGRPSDRDLVLGPVVVRRQHAIADVAHERWPSVAAVVEP
jgi:hypothetical protein